MLESEKKEKIIESIASLLKGIPIAEIKELLFEVRRHIESNTNV